MDGVSILLLGTNEPGITTQGVSGIANWVSCSCLWEGSGGHVVAEIELGMGVVLVITESSSIIGGT